MVTITVYYRERIQIKTSQGKKHTGQSPQKVPNVGASVVLSLWNNEWYYFKSIANQGSLFEPNCPEFLLVLHREGMIDCPHCWSQCPAPLEVNWYCMTQSSHPKSYYYTIQWSEAPKHTPIKHEIPKACRLPPRSGTTETGPLFGQDYILYCIIISFNP